MSDLVIRGRCLCHGHARECLAAAEAPISISSSSASISTNTSRAQNFYTCSPCLHQTTGAQCERCVEGFMAREFSPLEECEYLCCGGNDRRVCRIQWYSLCERTSGIGGLDKAVNDFQHALLPPDTPCSLSSCFCPCSSCHSTSLFSSSPLRE